MYVPIANWYHKAFKAPRRYHHLFDEIRRIKAKSILEVGTWNGNRAVQMISAAQTCHQDKIKYVGFDLFEELSNDLYQLEISKRPPTKAEVLDKLAMYNADVLLIQGNTLETLPAFVRSSETFDFIFIDGGHHVETIRSDWQSVSKLMHHGSVVIFDDYWRNDAHQSAKPIVDAIDTNTYRVEILPEVDTFNNSDFGRLEISFAKVTLK